MNRPGKKECLDLSLRESCQVCTVVFEQTPPSSTAPFSNHRNTRRTQGLHVTMNSALGHLQALRQLMSRHALVHLQEQQNRKQSISTHRTYLLLRGIFDSLPILPYKYDIRCHELSCILSIDPEKEHLSKRSFLDE